VFDEICTFFVCVYVNVRVVVWVYNVSKVMRKKVLKKEREIKKNKHKTTNKY